MFRFFCLLLLSSSALAAPSILEVWYLSNAKITELNKLLDRPTLVYYPRTAELQCQEMGDYCFDPQVGLYKKDDVGTAVEAKEVSDKGGPEIPVKGAIDRELIDCDKGNYFDIFCGKARKEEVNPTKLEMWVDTSSSMKEFDYLDKDGSCYRKQLITSVDKTCGFNRSLNVMMFDTSMKQAGTIDSLCQNQGLNDYKKLMNAIDRSTAKKLVVITDIYELHKEFDDYLKSKHAIVRGDKEPLTAQKLLGLADHLANLCK